MRRTFFGPSRSIAGAALIGLGLFILFENLADAAQRLSRLAGISAQATQTFGELTAVALAASEAFQSFLFDRGGFLRHLCGVLLSFWPLLLVGAGAVLLATPSRTESRNFQKNIREMSI
jgi:hypothetical protein